MTPWTGQSTQIDSREAPGTETESETLAKHPWRRYSHFMNDFVRDITTGETKRMKTSAMITITGIIIRWPVGPGVR